MKFLWNRGNLKSLTFLFVGILILSACKSKQQVLTIAGSRSVLPVVQEIADLYMSEHPEFVIEIHGIGSSAGMEATISGTSEIGMASRDLKEEEQVSLVPTIIALDVVAIIVHPENKIKDLTTNQVREIFSGKITNWSEVGGNNQVILIIDKEAGSGTKEVFEELIMGEDTLITETAIIMDGTAAARNAVSSDPAAIGYISLAAVTSEVKAISLDGITSSIENVQKGEYNLSRSFVLGTKPNTSPLASQFIEFILSEKGQEMIEAFGLIRVR